MRQITHIVIIIPSRVKKSVSLFQSAPLKPSQSSATRKIDRIRIATVASRMAPLNSLNKTDRRIRCFSGSMSSTPLWQRQLKLRRNTRKANRLTAWRKRPAIIMLIPVRAPLWVLAVSAIAPPIACKSRDKKSEVMKAMAIVRGRKRDNCSPWRTIMRVMQRYKAADIKTGAIVRQTRYLRWS